MNQYEQEIDNGIDLLDEWKSNWRDSITQPLDMGNCYKCVVGQAFGCTNYSDYEDALAKLGVISRWGDNSAVENGFDDDDNDYDSLTEAWNERLDQD